MLTLLTKRLSRHMDFRASFLHVYFSQWILSLTAQEKLSAERKSLNFLPFVTYPFDILHFISELRFDFLLGILATIGRKLSHGFFILTGRKSERKRAAISERGRSGKSRHPNARRTCHLSERKARLTIRVSRNHLKPMYGDIQRSWSIEAWHALHH